MSINYRKEVLIFSNYERNAAFFLHVRRVQPSLELYISKHRSALISSYEKNLPPKKCIHEPEVCVCVSVSCVLIKLYSGLKKNAKEARKLNKLNVSFEYLFFSFKLNSIWFILALINSILMMWTKSSCACVFRNDCRRTTRWWISYRPKTKNKGYRWTISVSFSKVEKKYGK